MISLPLFNANDSSEHFSISYVPSTGQKGFLWIISFSLHNHLSEAYYHCPCCVDVETEAEFCAEPTEGGCPAAGCLVHCTSAVSIGGVHTLPGLSANTSVSTKLMSKSHSDAADRCVPIVTCLKKPSCQSRKMNRRAKVLT